MQSSESSQQRGLDGGSGLEKSQKERGVCQNISFVGSVVTKTSQEVSPNVCYSNIHQSTMDFQGYACPQEENLPTKATSVYDFFLKDVDVCGE